MKTYCLDTNIFIQGWNQYYSMDLCPEYWQILARLARDGRIFSPIEVRREIEKTDDNLTRWAKDHPHIFRDIDVEVQRHLQDIMAHFPRLVDSTRQRSIADPWVIAFAIANNAVVVTKEYKAGDSSPKIKIPDVCEALNVPWMNDFEFAREIGIQFTATLRA